MKGFFGLSQNDKRVRIIVGWEVYLFKHISLINSKQPA
jgi:hypothetical protein